MLILPYFLMDLYYKYVVYFVISEQYIARVRAVIGKKYT